MAKDTSTIIYYHYMIMVVLLLAAAGGSYVAGVAHGKSIVKPLATTSGMVQNSVAGGTRFQGRGSGQGGGFATGTVSAVSGSTITVTGRDGTPSTVDLSSTTAITKTVSGTTGDIAVGQSLTIVGQVGSDGNVQATSIQIRPTAMPTPDANATSL